MGVVTGRGAVFGGAGPAVLFGEVVERDGVEQCLGDAFAVVEAGFDGGLADQAGQAADPSGGPFVQVGRQ